jgi:hypothetical protein
MTPTPRTGTSAVQPGPYDPHLDVGFSPLRGNNSPWADGYGQAA